MHSIDYQRAGSIDDAIRLAQQPATKFIGGGTNLLDLMKGGVEQPLLLVDISRLALADITELPGGGVRIGALASNTDAANHALIRERFPVLSQALLAGASPQLRNMATVGGNLLQRTRCPYFRNGAIRAYPCNKREPGSGCAGIGGVDRGQAVLGASDACNAVSPGDWPVALTAMDATIEISGPAGTRPVPISDFYRLPGNTPHLEFAIEAGEIVTGISVPKTAAGRNSTYLKVRDRESYAFALASAAVALRMDGNHVRQAHIALGGVATRPWRARGGGAFERSND